MDDLKQLKLVKNIYIVMSLLFCVLGIFLIYCTELYIPVSFKKTDKKEPVPKFQTPAQN